MSFSLPTPAQIVAKQQSHKLAVTNPQVASCWDLFTKWVNQDTKTGADLCGTFGLYKNEYIDALSNNLILFDVSHFDPVSIQLFIDEVNEVREYVNFSEETHQTTWTAIQSVICRGRGMGSTQTKAIRITPNQNPSLPKHVSNPRHSKLTDRKTAMTVWQTNMHQILKTDADALIKQLQAEMAKIQPVTKETHAPKYILETSQYHKKSVLLFRDNVNNFRDSSGNQVWLATYEETHDRKGRVSSTVTVVPYVSL